LIDGKSASFEGRVTVLRSNCYRDRHFANFQTTNTMMDSHACDYTAFASLDSDLAKYCFGHISKSFVF
jgi:hypothetical protein|tara:strand:+ start:1263 stop:1466 length:204 start_codon:yes stop_codon:yes gene_type:complete